MNITSKEFGKRVAAKMDEIMETMTIQQIVNCDIFQLNGEAIKLVQKELQS